MNTQRTSLLITALLFIVLAVELPAQSTNFTYQGRLDHGGTPASGIYDIQYGIYDGPAPGNGTYLSGGDIENVVISNGLFSVELLAEYWVFNGEPRWLGVEVRTNGPGPYTILQPWPEITPTPYAARALTVASDAFAGGYSGAVWFTNPSNTFTGTFMGTHSGDGGSLTNVTATTLGGLPREGFWQLGGNAGTTAGTNFLGTTDNEPLELKVNGMRALRIEPHPTSPNIVGGFSGNSIGNGTVGSIIGAGGHSGFENNIGSDSLYGVIGGGQDNNIDFYSWFSTIAGGIFNDIGTSTLGVAIGGGHDNDVSDIVGFATIAGGDANRIGKESDWSSILGGGHNEIRQNSLHAVIGGGGTNTIADDSSHSTIAGGASVDIGENSPFTAIVGGQGNRIGDTSPFSFISGGLENRIASSVHYAVIGGGWGNTILSNSWYSSIGGGVDNDIKAHSANGVIGGGTENVIGTNSKYAVVAGGEGNFISANSQYASIAGGGANVVAEDAQYAAISGGDANSIGGDSWFATIAGGSGNVIGTNADYSAIGGGEGNTAGEEAKYATVAGGAGNHVGGSYAYAAGRRAKAYHAGAFVWGDATDADFESTANNQFLLRASGGVGVGTTSPAAALHVDGGTDTEVGGGGFLVLGDVTGDNISIDENEIMARHDGATDTLFVNFNGGQVTLGGNLGLGLGFGTATHPVQHSSGAHLTAAGVWSSISDRDAKEEFAPIDPSDVLARVAALPVTQWRYKVEDKGVKHVGPTAQDFHAAFGLGASETAIGAVDADGVALAAIQGLNRKLEQEVKQKDEEIGRLKQRLEKLEQRLDASITGDTNR